MVGVSETDANGTISALSVTRLDGVRSRVMEALDGFQVAVAEDGHGALELARRIDPRVVVLDWEVPGLDPVDLTRRLRGFSDACVLVIAAGEEDRVVTGLRNGADDVVAATPSAREIAARVEALLRRARGAGGNGAAHGRVVAIGDHLLDRGARRLTLGGDEVPLTRTEFDILETLVLRAGSAVSRDDLLQRVWGSDRGGDDHVLDVHVSNLRQKLEPEPGAPRHIVTVRGVGYRLDGAGGG